MSQLQTNNITATDK